MFCRTLSHKLISSSAMFSLVAQTRTRFTPRWVKRPETNSLRQTDSDIRRGGTKTQTEAAQTQRARMK